MRASIKNIEIIAEVKIQSPFGWKSAKNWEELFSIADRTGDIVSIHTDPRWGGSFEALRRARQLTQKPILAKGIHNSDDDIRLAVSAGADWILAVGRVPGIYQERCIIEPRSLCELEKIPRHLRVLWNARDLMTGEKKKETFCEARALWGGWLCQASFIKTVEDIEPGADAALIGEHLQKFARSI